MNPNFYKLLMVCISTLVMPLTSWGNSQCDKQVVAVEINGLISLHNKSADLAIKTILEKFARPNYQYGKSISQFPIFKRTLNPLNRSKEVGELYSFLPNSSYCHSVELTKRSILDDIKKVSSTFTVIVHEVDQEAYYQKTGCTAKNFSYFAKFTKPYRLTLEEFAAHSCIRPGTIFGSNQFNCGGPSGEGCGISFVVVNPFDSTGEQWCHSLEDMKQEKERMMKECPDIASVELEIKPISAMDIVDYLHLKKPALTWPILF